MCDDAGFSQQRGCDDNVGIELRVVLNSNRGSPLNYLLNFCAILEEKKWYECNSMVDSLDGCQLCVEDGEIVTIILP